MLPCRPALSRSFLPMIAAASGPGPLNGAAEITGTRQEKREYVPNLACF